MTGFGWPGWTMRADTRAAYKSTAGILLGWPPEAGAKMSGKCSRNKKNHTSKGESGLLEVSKENGVDQIQITL